MNLLLWQIKSRKTTLKRLRVEFSTLAILWTELVVSRLRFLSSLRLWSSRRIFGSKELTCTLFLYLFSLHYVNFVYYCQWFVKICDFKLVWFVKWFIMWIRTGLLLGSIGSRVAGCSSSNLRLCLASRLLMWLATFSMKNASIRLSSETISAILTSSIKRFTIFILIDRCFIDSSLDCIFTQNLSFKSSLTFQIFFYSSNLLRFKSWSCTW